VILVRRETSPEDIRGMHAAAGVLTERGGMTSHAAMVARSLGLPGVVGASGIVISRRDGSLTAEDGRVFKAGDCVTIDGTSGAALVGEVPLLEHSQGDAFRTLLEWADEARDIRVRANADTIPRRGSPLLSRPRASGFAEPSTCSSRRIASR